MNKSMIQLIAVAALIVSVVVLTACDKEAAEQRIFDDPVMKASLLEKMMADADMMQAMIDHSISDQILSDTIMVMIIENEQLRARMLTKAFADSVALDDIIFRVKGDKELKKRVTARSRR